MPFTVPAQRRTREEYWAGGYLRYMLRPPGQRRFYDFLRGFKRQESGDFGPLVAICHRHFGKTTASVIYAWSRCIKTPGSNWIFLAPLENQCERNMRQPLALLMRQMPGNIHVRRARRVFTIYNDAWPRGSPPSCFQYLGSDGRGRDRKSVV